MRRAGCLESALPCKEIKGLEKGQMQGKQMWEMETEVTYYFMLDLLDLTPLSQAAWLKPGQWRGS